jgi:Tol biopolymer transport system component
MAFGFFSASTNGVLVYRIGGAGQVNRVTWFDRQGKALGEAGESGEYWGLSLSPDESRAAVSWLNPAQLPMPVDIWFLDFLRGTKTRFTRGEGNNQSPVWTPDGSRIIFLSNREEGIYNLFQKPVSGAKDAQVLFKSSEEKDVNSCSSDGRLLLYTAENPETKADLFLLPLEGKHRPIPFLQTEFVEFDGRFSPDMRWVAYTSDESGRNEVYVRRFSQTPGGELSADGGKWIISKEGGTGPRWRRDGRELYYRAPDGKVMAVEITPGKELQVKTVKPLFQAPVTSPKIANSYIYFYWDATSDGKRFLMPTPIAEGSPSRFHVTLNWTALLNK